MRRSGDVEYVKILEDYNGKSRVSELASPKHFERLPTLIGYQFHPLLISP